MNKMQLDEFQMKLNSLQEEFNKFYESNKKTPEQRFLELLKDVDISRPFVDFEKCPDGIFWFDTNGELIFRYNFKKGFFWIRYSKIWVVLKEEFKMNHHEIVEFMKKMVEEHFKLKDITPFYDSIITRGRWKNISN